MTKCDECGEVRQLHRSNATGTDICEDCEKKKREEFGAWVEKNHRKTMLGSDDPKELRAMQEEQRLVEQVITLPELMEKNLEPPKWRVQNILPEGGIAFLGAAPASYKSYLALHMALSCATGKPFLEKFDTEKTTILYFDEENGECELSRRFEILSKGFCLDTFPENIHLLFYSGIKLDTEEGARSIEVLVEDTGAKILILDSLVRLMQGEENDSRAVNKVYDALKPLLAKGCSVLILHHLRKNNGGADNMNSLRGSSDLSAQAMVVLLSKKTKNGCTLSMPKNRLIPDNLLSDMKIKVTNPSGWEESIRFEHEGVQPRRKTRGEKAAKQILDWGRNNSIKDSFRISQLVERVKKHKISKNAVYEALDVLEERGLAHRVELGKVQFDPTVFIDDKTLSQNQNGKVGKVGKGDLSTYQGETLGNLSQIPKESTLIGKVGKTGKSTVHEEIELIGTCSCCIKPKKWLVARIEGKDYCLECAQKELGVSDV